MSRCSGSCRTERNFPPLCCGCREVNRKDWSFSNDRYLLENEKFRLYYTAEGEEAHNFIVVVEDNFGNSYELEFDFNNRNVKDEGIVSVVPIGNFKPLLR